MARLNDLPTPAESVEALKRRFVRQNRELARVNSIQSVRIQSLESDISRLLCENASLRERVISLNHEIDRFESARMLNDGVYDLKGRLDAKLAELGNLVVELGMLPRKVGRAFDTRRNSSSPDEEKYSDSHCARVAIGSDIHAGFDDARLPVILEDKYYPRKTLEPEELHDMIVGSSDVPDSPEIGPPPVAHLDAEDSPERDLSAETFEFTKPTDMLIANKNIRLPPNLETRKKRKDGPVSVDIDSDDQKKESFISAGESRHGLKPGYKRKFSAREEDDRYSLNMSEAEDDFQFSRTVHLSRKVFKEHTPTRKATPLEDAQADLNKESKDQVPIRRRVLEPKSTNVNPASPKKQVVADTEDDKAQHKLDRLLGDGHKAISTGPIATSRRSTQESEPSTSEPGTFDKGRKEDRDTNTSVAEEIGVSLQTGERASSSPESQEVSATGSNTFGIAARPTRRPRSVVSYVEPNLRDKMRRPTKELVDAVGEDRFRRASNSQVERTDVSGEGQATSTSKTKIWTTPGKIEDVAVSKKLVPADSTDPNNDLEGELLDSSLELLGSVITGRKRRTLSANKDDLLQTRTSDTLPTESASTLIPGARKASDGRRRTGNRDSFSNSGSEKQDGTAQNTLQAGPGTSFPSTRSFSKVPLTMTRQSRRHSSNPAGSRGDNSPRRSADSLTQAQRLDFPSRMGSRRQESDNGAFGDDLTPINGVRKLPMEYHNADEVRSSYVSPAIIEGVTGVSDRVVMDAEQLKRGQRAAARRRRQVLPPTKITFASNF